MGEEEEEDLEEDLGVEVREGGFGAGRSGSDGEFVSEVMDDDIGPAIDVVSTLVAEGVKLREEEAVGSTLAVDGVMLSEEDALWQL